MPTATISHRRNRFPLSDTCSDGEGTVGRPCPPEGRSWGRRAQAGPELGSDPQQGPCLQDCRNLCCNATTCRLAEGAECAHGACCHECRVSPPPPAQLRPQVTGWAGTKQQAWVRLGPAIPSVSLALLGQVKPAGQLCRPKKDACDLEEHCDGLQPACPEDAFQENGTVCAGGYCYGGACPTRTQRCQDLWGPGEAGSR